jgi:hypothetical protein
VGNPAAVKRQALQVGQDRWARVTVKNRVEHGTSGVGNSAWADRYANLSGRRGSATTHQPIRSFDQDDVFLLGA